MKKPNRKKKDYVDEDVNGFLEYLQQTGQSLPRGERVGGRREEEQELREEVETALKKDRRREDRRIKRKKAKTNNMVSDFKSHSTDTEPGSGFIRSLRDGILCELTGSEPVQTSMGP